eukprot:SAG11_NODE_1765_length_4285_cov_3.009795_2_plen_214_part_00
MPHLSSRLCHGEQAILSDQIVDLRQQLQQHRQLEPLASAPAPAAVASAERRQSVPRVEAAKPEAVVLTPTRLRLGHSVAVAGSIGGHETPQQHSPPADGTPSPPGAAGVLGGLPPNWQAAVSTAVCYQDPAKTEGLPAVAIEMRTPPRHPPPTPTLPPTAEQQQQQQQQQPGGSYATPRLARKLDDQFETPRTAWPQPSMAVAPVPPSAPHPP